MTIRIGLTVHLLDFNGLVENLKLMQGMDKAEIHIAAINCGPFTMSTMKEVEDMACYMAGTTKRENDAATEYESWQAPKLRAVK